MAISSYLRECGYDLGGLLPKIYLIHKNALKLSFKAKGIEVSVSNNKDGDIYVLEGSMVQYKQEETYNGKYRFTSTLEITINEQYKEPFFYGLRTLRTNQYYIIIEDKKGIQYLINPELYTKMTYEYSFGDGEGAINNVVINYNNLSNYPLLIFNENIDNNKTLFGSDDYYNLGQVKELIMFDHKNFKVKDDGVMAYEMYLNNVSDVHKIDHMKESLTLSEIYDGTSFITSLSFSIPLDDKYGWAYRLLEFQDNRYSGILRTSNDNYIIMGVEMGLIPSYTIETSEEDSLPNLVNVKMEQRSQYPLVYSNKIEQYRWTEDEPLCFGFDKYQMLVKEKSEDWGETWIKVEPEVKKKGDIIATNSIDCKEFNWVYDSARCVVGETTYEKWVNTDEFICQNGNKYIKTRKQISNNQTVWQDTDEYGIGELIEKNSDACRYIAVRWIESDDDAICYEIDERYTYLDDKTITTCSGYDKVLGKQEYVSIDGVKFYNGDVVVDEVIELHSCECGWTGLTYVFNNEYICGGELGSSYDQESKYEIWREAKECDLSKFTGNVEYRNPQKSFDCGYVLYQWREDMRDVCYVDLPENVTEVTEAPEINKDFE